MKRIKIALLGLGTVGGGVYEVFNRQKDEFLTKTGAEAEIAKILVRSLEKDRPGIPGELLTDSWDEILNDESIDIVVEVTGGIEPARTRILEALNAGKDVVTANKDLLALHGGELFTEAERLGRDLLFEASVAGGIPIIRPLKECLAGNHIAEIMGIVNGTTNYILTKMTEDGMDFDEALALATELGYAEADPTADIEGLDAGRKVAIMASLAFNSRVTFDDVDTEGITGITARDIEFAGTFGKVIKLLGITRLTEEGIEAGVHPVLLDKTHPLASVRDSFNAVFVHGDAIDDAMFYGRGAGALPTASAVMGDIMEICRNIVNGCSCRVSSTCDKEIKVKAPDDICSKYFIRLKVKDTRGVFASIASVLANNEISLLQVEQLKSVDGIAELVVVTEEVEKKHINDALLVFEGMSIIDEICSLIQVY